MDEDHSAPAVLAEAPKAETRKSRWFFSSTDHVTRLTGWIATYTVILLFIAMIQAWAFVASERAFLLPASMTLNPSHLATNAETFFTLEIRNGGKSTAFANRVVILPLLAKELPPAPKYNDENFEESLMPVLAASTERSTWSARLGADRDLADVQRGVLKLYFFGYIQYRDTFSLFGSRRTGFCYVYTPHSDANVSSFESCRAAQYTYADY